MDAAHEKSAPRNLAGLRRLPRAGWAALAATAALLGGAAAGGVAWQVADGGAAPLLAALAALAGAAAGAASVAAIALPVRLLAAEERLARELHDLRRAAGETEARLAALLHVHAAAGGLPLDLGGWAADAALLDLALRLVSRDRPGLVVECGSGTSTVVLASVLERLGRGRVVAIEHDPAFAASTLAALRDAGLSHRATVAVAPIEEREVGGETLPWYGPAFEEALDAPIDLLVVDGPPGDLAPRSRYPALPLLGPRLAPGARVLLDDGFRSDERAIALAWACESGLEARFLPRGHGVWLLSPPGAPLPGREPLLPAAEVGPAA